MDPGLRCYDLGRWFFAVDFRRCVTGSPMLVDNMAKVFNAVFGEDPYFFAPFRRGIVVVGAQATVFRELLD